MNTLLCSIGGCDKPATKRGWCEMHYRRWQRHGDPLTNHRPEQVIGSLETRFWAKTDKRGRDECWVWLGYRLPSGYGHFRTGGRADGHTWLAHRLAYTMNHGPIPLGLEISHTCANPACVNPAHLVAETHAENLHRSPTARFKVNVAKTHCPQGHEYTAENTILRQRKDGGYSRQCRECGRLAVARYQAKKRHGTVY